MPVNSLIHPTEFPERRWCWDDFTRNREKKVIQVGWWIRKLHSIFRLDSGHYQKVWLPVYKSKMIGDLMNKEQVLLIKQGLYTRKMYSTVDVREFLPNDEYDVLLSENVVFLDLYDASANNTIIECIARGTPVLVNPLEAVVEYLGKNYPLFFNSLTEAADKLKDESLIKRAHEYLLECETRSKLDGNYFRSSFEQSSIYQSLALADSKSAPH